MDKLSSLINNSTKRNITNQGVVINPKITKYRIFHNSKIKSKQTLIIMAFCAGAALLAKNNTELMDVFGFKISNWKFCLILALLLTIKPITQIITNNKPSLIISTEGIAIKTRGFFLWNEINNIQFETRHDNDGTNDEYYLSIHSKKTRIPIRIDQMTKSKEEIESIVDYFWNKNRPLSK